MYRFTTTYNEDYGPFLESINGLKGNNAKHTYWELLIQSQNGTIVTADVVFVQEYLLSIKTSKIQSVSICLFTKERYRCFNREITNQMLVDKKQYHYTEMGITWNIVRTQAKERRPHRDNSTRLTYTTLRVDPRQETTAEPMQCDSSCLTKEERRHRFQEGLCLYCGSSGHVVRECHIRPNRSISVSHRGDINTKPLSQGFIQHSTSPLATGFFFVRKKDGSLRPCIDYHNLNQISRKFAYRLPLAPAALEQLREAKYFSKLDLRSAYNLIHIKKGYEWKTTFSTTRGHYEYTIMPYGLSVAPAVFQAFINDTPCKYIGNSIWYIVISIVESDHPRYKMSYTAPVEQIYYVSSNISYKKVHFAKMSLQGGMAFKM
ncbi:hypothetical protein P4O66_005744 [Electrophorus voltai]|uniref:CCHC-type domain-containing protein n=1 Tax=Electrophorus voltai TaxID=2609070 RepID=A0AAD8ZM08_9TELE|nr:hypothetical protein P4O66_005744 [Electrophorus voltai]